VYLWGRNPDGPTSIDKVRVSPKVVLDVTEGRKILDDTDNLTKAFLPVASRSNY